MRSWSRSFTKVEARKTIDVPSFSREKSFISQTAAIRCFGVVRSFHDCGPFMGAVHLCNGLSGSSGFLEEEGKVARGDESGAVLVATDRGGLEDRERRAPAVDRLVGRRVGVARVLAAVV